MIEVAAEMTNNELHASLDVVGAMTRARYARSGRDSLTLTYPQDDELVRTIELIKGHWANANVHPLVTWSDVIATVTGCFLGCHSVNRVSQPGETILGYQVLTLEGQVRLFRESMLDDEATVVELTPALLDPREVKQPERFELAMGPEGLNLAMTILADYQSQNSCNVTLAQAFRIAHLRKHFRDGHLYLFATHLAHFIQIWSGSVR